jgi:hypothetical protein
MDEESGIHAELRGVLPDGVRDGDILIYMSGRLLVVDHLAPEAYTMNLTELEAADAADRPTPY